MRRASWSGLSSRRWATESNSSKNSTHGTLRRAWRKIAFTLRADSPRYDDTRSPVETCRNDNPNSPAVALATNVLPVPGRPCRRMPFQVMR